MDRGCERCQQVDMFKNSQTNVIHAEHTGHPSTSISDDNRNKPKP